MSGQPATDSQPECMTDKQRLMRTRVNGDSTSQLPNNEIGQVLGGLLQLVLEKRGNGTRLFSLYILVDKNVLL